ncbi:MAG: TlpA disulfide reductase family protein [Fuerstiella sp.]|nr:TlpA disulfide reductase family protein [Fuerstiella sp.]
MKLSWLSLTLFLCGSLLVGCGESDTGTSGTGTAASDAPASDSPGTQTEAPTASAAPVEADPVIAGLTEDFEDLPAEFADIKTAYESSPTNPQAVGEYVGTLQQIGMMQQQKKNQGAADLAFVRGAEILSKALAANVEFPMPQLAPDVFFNHACVLNRQGKGAEALAALTQAVEAGFRGPRQVDLDMIQKDERLASVQALPEFAGKIAEWEAQLADLKKKHEEMLVQHAKEELAAGTGFPFDFDLTDVHGKPISLATMKGRVCIVDIWGTWCPPCRQEIPAFVQLQDKYGDYGFQMIGLNQEQGPSDEANTKIVTDFMANNSMNYPCAIIPDEVMGQVPEFQGFPTTLFIDHHGKVRLKSVGFHEYGYMAAIVETLLQEQAVEAKAAATN